MKSKVNKFMFFNFEKEEKWLNDMAARGIDFVDYSFCKYLFEEGSPGRYTYRIELLDNPVGHPESVHYIKFLEETGVECVSSVGKRLYMRKPTEDGPFDLFSDLATRLRQYTKIRNAALTIVLFNTAAIIINLYLCFASKVIPHINIAAAATIFAICFLPTTVAYAQKIKAIKSELQVRE